MVAGAQGVLQLQGHCAASQSSHVLPLMDSCGQSRVLQHNSRRLQVVTGRAAGWQTVKQPGVREMTCMAATPAYCQLSRCGVKLLFAHSCTLITDIPDRTYSVWSHHSAVISHTTTMMLYLTHNTCTTWQCYNSLSRSHALSSQCYHWHTNKQM